jgi:hypothetical protein
VEDDPASGSGKRGPDYKVSLYRHKPFPHLSDALYKWFQRPPGEALAVSFHSRSRWSWRLAHRQQFVLNRRERGSDQAMPAAIKDTLPNLEDEISYPA